MLNLVFFLENCLLNWKNGISDFFYSNTYFLHCKILFLLYTRRNLVFDVKSCIFLRKPSFDLEKRVSNFFPIEKLTFYTVKYYFWCRVLFSKTKTSFFDVKSCIFFRKPSFPLEKRDL